VLPVEDERAATCDDIRKALAGNARIDIESGEVTEVLNAFTGAGSEQRFLIFGSLYLAGAVLATADGSDAKFQPELNG